MNKSRNNILYSQEKRQSHTEEIQSKNNNNIGNICELSGVVKGREEKNLKTIIRFSVKNNIKTK